MGFDQAGADQLPLRVIFLRLGRKTAFDGGDAAAFKANVEHAFVIAVR